MLDNSEQTTAASLGSPGKESIVEFRQAEHLLAIATYGSVSKAANHLRIAQPSLSQSLQALERETRCILFHRVRRGLIPTVAGEALVRSARQLLRDVTTARSTVAYAAGVAEGQLDLGAIGLPLERLPFAIAAFGPRFPQVKLRVFTPAHEEDVKRDVQLGRTEVGFTTLGPNDLVQSAHGENDLEITPLGLGELVCVLPPGTDPALPNPLPLRMIPRLPTTAVPVGSHAREAVETALRGAFIPPKAGVVTAHRYTQLPLVLRGVGMAFVNREHGRWAERLGAVVRPLSPPIAVPFGMVKRAGTLSPPAHQFVQTAEDYLSGYGLDHIAEE